MSFIWIIALIILFIAYKLYHGSLLLGFSLGTFITFLLSLFLPSGLFQLLSFLLISLFSSTLLSLKYARYFTKYSPHPYHIDDLIGRQATVVKPIGNSPLDSGTIKLDNELWHALSTTNESIPTGTIVTVETLKGICVKVTPCI